MFKMPTKLLALGMSLGLLAAPAVADAQPRHDRGDHGRHYGRHDNGNHYGQRRNWRGHRGRRVCHWQRHHGRGYQRCYYR